MIQILNLYRLNGLLAKYTTLKSEAKELLTKGNMKEYLFVLNEIQKARSELVDTAKYQ